MAATKREIRTTLALDGEKAFQDAMDGAYRNLKILGSEMRANTAIFADNADGMEALTKKGEILGKEIEQQKAIVESLTKAVDEAATAYGEGDKKTDGYRIKLNNATATLAKMETELQSNRKAMDTLGDETQGTAGDMNKAEQAIKNVDNAAQNAEKSTKNLSDGFTVMKGTVANLITDMVRYSSTAIKQFISDSVELASDINEVDNVVSTAFGSAKTEIKDFADSAAEQYGLSTLAAQQYAGKLGAAFNALGLREQAAEMSTTLAGLSGDLASFWNMTADEAYAKIFSGVISGETEGLKSMGVVMSQTNLEAFALKKGMEKSYSSMTEAKKATLRYQYVLDATKLSQGDFAKTSDSMANQTKIAQLNIENMKTELGQKLYPVITDVLKKFNEWTKSDYAKNIFEKLGNAAADLTKKIAPVLIKAFTLVVNNLDTIKKAAAAITGLALTAKIYKLVGNLESLSSILKGTATSQTLLNAAMGANPIGAVIVAAGSLLAVLGVLDTSLPLLSNDIKGTAIDSENLATSMEATIPAVESVIPAFNKYESTVKRAGTATDDTSRLLSASGQTIAQLDTQISETESNITKIIQGAIEDQRQLRNDELVDINEYTQKLLQLEQEKLDLYSTQQIAQLEKLKKAKGDLTLEESAQQLTTVKSYADQAFQAVEESYNLQYAMIENYHKAEGTLGSSAYEADMQKLYDHYKEQIKAVEDNESAAVEIVTNSSESWIQTELNKYSQLKSYEDDYAAHMKNGMAESGANLEDVMATSAGILDAWKGTIETMDFQAQNAFLQMVANANTMGIELDDQTKAAALTILNAYKDLFPEMETYSADALGVFQNLPDEMQTSGKNAVIALFTGMEDQIPGIKNASEMSTDTLINTVINQLGLGNGTSTVMEEYGENSAQGFINGINEKNGDVKDAAYDLGDDAVNSTKKALDSQSPSKKMKKVGMDLVQGLQDGMESKKGSVSATASTIGQQLVQTFKDIFGIRSPSRVMKDAIGKPLMQGVAQGMAENAKLVSEQMESLIPDEKGIKVAMEVTRKFYDLADVAITQTTRNKTSGAQGNGEASKTDYTTEKPIYIKWENTVNANDLSYARQQKLNRESARNLVRELKAANV